MLRLIMAEHTYTRASGTADVNAQERTWPQGARTCSAYKNFQQARLTAGEVTGQWPSREVMPGEGTMGIYTSRTPVALGGVAYQQARVSTTNRRSASGPAARHQQGWGQGAAAGGDRGRGLRGPCLFTQTLVTSRCPDRLKGKK